EKKEIAEQERRDEIRNKIAYSHGVYDGNVKDVKKDILQKTNEEYKEQAKHEARAEYMNAGYQTSQTVQKGADVAINAMEKVASLTPATAPIGKAIKKTYIVGKNVSSNLGHLTAGTKTLGQATMDAAIGTTGDLIKDSADGFGQKMLYNTTMEGGKTVFQGLVDGKSAEEIRDETIKNIKKEANNTINEGLNQAVFGDTPLTQIITDLDNMDKNDD
ncbi:MAG: hypothetical protein II738_02710, partial [Clostridia bacterium]|nr:hypothetical protein [Clostridia bacterium]